MMFVLLLIYHVFIDDVIGHPQCLDYRAPFKPESALHFCSQYTELGCCSTTNDEILRDEFDYIKTQVTREDWQRCGDFVQEILCQKCSPYAAHIYDAEGSSQARKFPGLCQHYCYNYFEACSNLTMLLHPGLVTAEIMASKRSFCDKVSLQDKDYCYPDLLTNPMILRNWTIARDSDDISSGCLCLEEIKRGLSNPLWARHARDGTGRLFVAEQKGRVHIYNIKTKKWNRSCFLNLSGKVSLNSWAGDERGFLGMAFHPSFSANGRFFIYYSVKTSPDEVIPPEMSQYPCHNKIRVSQLRLSADDPDTADMNSEQILLEVLQPYENHNGGEMLFGQDGYLYIFIGDGGGAGDPLNAGQNKSMLLGKVLRIDVDSGQPYAIPPDNPFVGQPGSRPEIYAYGVRNIWRCGVDRGRRDTGEFKGRTLCGDVGQDAFEEINVLKRGANYGWNSREGFECYNMETCGTIGSEELPIHAYNHTFGKSVTGGVFYRGCESPSLDGQYIYGDYISSRLFSLSESGGKWTNREVHLCGSSLCQGNLVGHLQEYILSFGEDEEGEIYLLGSLSSSSGKCDGKLYKIVDPLARGDPANCKVDATLKERLQVPKRKQPRQKDNTVLYKSSNKAKVNKPEVSDEISTRTLWRKRSEKGRGLSIESNKKKNVHHGLRSRTVAWNGSKYSEKKDRPRGKKMKGKRPKLKMTLRKHEEGICGCL
nr:HHIP-like protein 1; partial [Biomphalaria glabrata]